MPTKLQTRAPFISAESLAVGAAAETLATAGATIPQNTAGIWFYCPTGDALHWLPNGTPTSSYGHTIQAGSWGYLASNQHGAKIISDDASDVALILVYERGAGKQSEAYSLSAPY